MKTVDWRAPAKRATFGTDISEGGRREQMTNDSNLKTAFERIEEAAREIATLFIALAPLDVVLGADRPHAFRNGLIFVGMGVSFFVLTLINEGKRLRG